MNVENRDSGVADYERSDFNFRCGNWAFFNCLNKLGGGAVKVRKELYIELFEKKYKGAKSLEEIISISEHELKYQTQKLRGEERRKRRKNAKTN